MKSSEELTGISKEELKEDSIRSFIEFYYDDHKLPDTDTELENGFLNVKINRYDARLLTAKALKQSLGKTPDDRTINKYLTGLLLDDVLRQNPTSHITKNRHIKPSNDTMYFINPKPIEFKRQQLIAKKQKFLSEKNAIHTPKFNLLSYMHSEAQKTANPIGDAENIDQQTISKNSIEL
jgi:hypothetical protein